MSYMYCLHLSQDSGKENILPFADGSQRGRRTWQVSYYWVETEACGGRLHPKPTLTLWTHQAVWLCPPPSHHPSSREQLAHSAKETLKRSAWKSGQTGTTQLLSLWLTREPADKQCKWRKRKGRDKRTLLSSVLSVCRATWHSVVIAGRTEQSTTCREQRNLWWMFMSLRLGTGNVVTRGSINC